MINYRLATAWARSETCFSTYPMRASYKNPIQRGLGVLGLGSFLLAPRLTHFFFYSPPGSLLLFKSLVCSKLVPLTDKTWQCRPSSNPFFVTCRNRHVSCARPCDRISSESSDVKERSAWPLEGNEKKALRCASSTRCVTSSRPVWKTTKYPVDLFRSNPSVSQANHNHNYADVSASRGGLSFGHLNLDNRYRRHVNPLAQLGENAMISRKYKNRKIVHGILLISLSHF